jgi:hypothetical protein
MYAACFTVSPFEHLVSAIQEQDIDVRAPCSKLSHDFRKALEKIFLASVEGERHIRDRRRRRRTQVEELWNELNRKVVDTIEREIFEGGHRGGLA